MDLCFKRWRNNLSCNNHSEYRSAYDIIIRSGKSNTPSRSRTSPFYVGDKFTCSECADWGYNQTITNWSECADWDYNQLIRTCWLRLNQLSCWQPLKHGYHIEVIQVMFVTHGLRNNCRSTAFVKYHSYPKFQWKLLLWWNVTFVKYLYPGDSLKYVHCMVTAILHSGVGLPLGIYCTQVLYLYICTKILYLFSFSLIDWWILLSASLLFELEAFNFIRKHYLLNFLSKIFYHHHLLRWSSLSTIVVYIIVNIMYYVKLGL